MQLGPIETPAVGPAMGFPGQLTELGHVSIGVVVACEALQILANQLIEALA